MLFPQESQDQKTCFVKIHAPWKVLLKYAEIMRLKMPLKEDRPDETTIDMVEENDDICGYKACSCFSFCSDPCKLNSPYIQVSKLF